jgi:hypothetical protein
MLTRQRGSRPRLRRRWRAFSACVCIAVASLLAAACHRDPVADTHVCSDSGDVRLQTSLSGDDLVTAMAALKADGVRFSLYHTGEYKDLAAPPATPEPLELVIITTTARSLLGKTDELLNFEYDADRRLTQTYCQHLYTGL